MSICEDKHRAEESQLEMGTVREKETLVVQSTKTPVIFYGAGEFARILFATAHQREFTLQPPIEQAVCFADASPGKQGTTHLGLPVMSLSDALLNYPDAKIWIALGKKKKRELIAGFDEEILRKVLNPPCTTHMGCGFLNSKLEILDKEIGFCCWQPFQNIPPGVKLNGDYEKLADRLLELREFIVSGVNDPNVDTPCDDCICLTEDVTNRDVDYRISVIGDSANGLCNFNCIYCSELRHRHNHKEENMDVDIFRLFDVFMKRNLISEDLHIGLARGELAVLPNKNKYFEYFRDTPSTIFTNASVYDEQIHRKLKNGTADLIVSIDAGTRETFRYIRGMDCFERVACNLEKYSRDRKGMITLKYIVFPQVNDELDDVIGFCRLCTQLSPDKVAIHHNNQLSVEDFNTPKTISCVEKMVELLNQANLKTCIESTILCDLLKRQYDGDGSKYFCERR